MLLKLPRSMRPLPAFLMAASAGPMPGADTAYDFSGLDSFITANLPNFEENVAVYLFEGEEPIYAYEAVFDLDTRIPIASASKWIAAGVILAVAEAGFFELDDPISRYVAEFDRPDKREITIRQAFSMTAGMVPENLLENGLARNPAYTHERSVELIAQLVGVVSQLLRGLARHARSCPFVLGCSRCPETNRVTQTDAIREVPQNTCLRLAVKLHPKGVAT
jgi:CubicO group peptidase (beta-lactamase class C family)